MLAFHAPFRGSLGSLRLNAAVVGMAGSPGGFCAHSVPPPAGSGRR
ncbi:MAG: hypothetical protein M0007_05085 [Actinomycetota bacterium]|nr:hypothetical protein [Actinomycetota bacterium]